MILLGPDEDWEGCRHGVVEGYCHQCMGVSPEEARRMQDEAWERIRAQLTSQPRPARVEA